MSSNNPVTYNSFGHALLDNSTFGLVGLAVGHFQSRIILKGRRATLCRLAFDIIGTMLIT